MRCYSSRAISSGMTVTMWVEDDCWVDDPSCAVLCAVGLAVEERLRANPRQLLAADITTKGFSLPIRRVVGGGGGKISSDISSRSSTAWRV